MKACYYKKNEDEEYGWYLEEWTDTPACKCIMAVAEGKTVQLNELDRLCDDGVITPDELHAIYAFDGGRGKDEDSEIIKKLADRVKVELVQK